MDPDVTTARAVGALPGTSERRRGNEDTKKGGAVVDVLRQAAAIADRRQKAVSSPTYATPSHAGNQGLPENHQPSPALAGLSTDDSVNASVVCQNP